MVSCFTCCWAVSQSIGSRAAAYGDLDSGLCPSPTAGPPSPTTTVRTKHDVIPCCTDDLNKSALHLHDSQFGSLSMSITFINYSVFITLIQALITSQLNYSTSLLFSSTCHLFPLHPPPHLYCL